jgi:molecular chaperone GrpE
MSDATSALVAASLDEFGAKAVNPDAVESILADFRSWLRDAAEVPLPEPVPVLDVATVLQHFTALRQEVNLQTKSSRSALEQNAQAVALLQPALEALQRQPNDKDEALRPLLKTLIDAHDALSLAQREVQRLFANPPALPTPEKTLPPRVEVKLPFWARWVGLGASIEEQIAPLRKWHDEQPPPPGLDEHVARFRQVLDALLVGYAMSLQRIERAFEQQVLEAIPCIGEPFNPETMEVAEVVREEGRSSTEVLQEIRRGYLWRGRLFRYAQVRVAKP